MIRQFTFFVAFLSLFALQLRADVLEPHFANAATLQGLAAAESSSPQIAIDDLRKFVAELASEEFEGRGTGDRGEVKATAYLASFFTFLGLKPEGSDDTFYQPFPIDIGLEMVGENQLGWNETALKSGDDFLPLSISANAEVDETEAVFVGFGIETEDYNSFEGLDVEGKWMVTLRGVPKELDKQLRRLGTLVAKAKTAKDKGAAGIIFIKAGNEGVNAELIPPSINVGSKDRHVPAFNVTDGAALQLLKPEGELSELFEAYYEGEKIVGRPLEERISAKVNLQKIEASGRNVLGRLVVEDEPSAEAIMIGGHIDHLGYGNRGGTLAKGEDTKRMHVGADDNASGIAAIMELAQHFTALKQAGELELKRDLIFVGWSGEEMGLVGSRHYIKTAKESSGAETLHPAISAYINLDMVGRLRGKPLKLQGAGSSDAWAPILAGLAKQHDLEIQQSPSPFLPTDAAPIYSAGVPVIAAFTGLHPEYHTPFDTPDKVDYEGLHKVSSYLADLIQQLANREDALVYTEFVRPNQNPKVSLGIAFEAAGGEGGGLKVTQVVEDSPAAKAGVKVGDVLNHLDGKKVNNRESLFRAIAELNANKEYPLAVKRGDEAVNLTIKPVARENG